jgi:copper chaperone CopZ
MKVDGVKRTRVHWEKGEVWVEYDPARASPVQIVEALDRSGVFRVARVEDLVPPRPAGGAAGGK